MLGILYLNKISSKRLNYIYYLFYSVANRMAKYYFCFFVLHHGWRIKFCLASSSEKEKVFINGLDNFPPRNWLKYILGYRFRKGTRKNGFWKLDYYQELLILHFYLLVPLRN